MSETVQLEAEILRLRDECFRANERWRRAKIECQQVEDEFRKVGDALDELVKLQAHYAMLLNAHDGGNRHQFRSGAEWIARLAVTSGGSDG